MSVVREIWGGGGLKERAEGWVGFRGAGEWKFPLIENWGGGKMAALKTPPPGTAVCPKLISGIVVVLLPRAVLSDVLVCLACCP